MGLKADVPVYDLSLIRGLWEIRVKKHRQRQKKEQERVEQSALARIDQQWQYRIYCKTLKTTERNLLHHYLERSRLPDVQPHSGDHHTHISNHHTCTDSKQEDQTHQEDQSADSEKLIFQLDGDQWTDFPRELQWMTYLKEWHIRGTKIHKLPEYLNLFTQLNVLEIPKNQITELPPSIGHLTALRMLNISYNRLSRVPPELGNCENLERLELAGNRNLSELPFELSTLKQVVHLDISENQFISIPICALRMDKLKVLDLSNNKLNDLPQDMDRLEQLVTLLVHKNHLTYLPFCLTNIPTLKMIVVSGDELTSIPTRLCSNPEIKFIRLYDSLTSEDKRKQKESKSKRKRWRGQKEEEVKDGRDKEVIEAYISTLTDRESVPYSTTRVSISCQL